jgi:hypothetical protein
MGRIVEPVQAAEGEEPVAGLEGATITLDTGERHFEAVSRSDGRFLFTDLAAGSYRVQARKRGYVVVSAPEEPLRLGDGGCIEIALEARPDRRVYGHVYAADGGPGSGIRVVLLPATSLNLPAEAHVIDTSSGKDGRYEMKNVPPGKYYLGVNLDRPESGQAPYPRTFYPGTSDPEMAGMIEIGEHETVVEADLPLPGPTMERTLAGVVLWSDGKPARGATLHLEDPRFPWRIHSVLATADANGSFTVRYYEGAEYRLHAVSACSEVADCKSATPVMIAPGLVPDLTLVLDQAGHSVMEAFRRAVASGTAVPRPE